MMLVCFTSIYVFYFKNIKLIYFFDFLEKFDWARPIARWFKFEKNLLNQQLILNANKIF